jgi:hypothetical protein
MELNCNTVIARELNCVANVTYTHTAIEEEDSGRLVTAITFHSSKKKSNINKTGAKTIKN